MAQSRLAMLGQGASIGPLAGLEYVRARGEEGRQRGRQSVLSRLAAEAYGAPAEQQRGLVQQAIGVNPEAGFALGKGLDTDRATQMEGLATKARYVVGMAKVGQSQAIAPVYAQLAQEARALGLGEVPTEWSDSYIPGLEQIAAYGMKPGDDTTPADIRSLQMLQANPELAALDKERRQYSGMVPKLVETSQGYGWGTPGAGIALAPLNGVAGQGQRPAVPAPALFAALGQKYGIQPTSVQRTPKRNQEVGGVANSYHLTGQAADWVVPQQYKAQFMADAQANGFQALDEGDHIHLEPIGSPGGSIAQPKPSDRAPPAGYRETAGGGLEFIPGGPADPSIKPTPASKPMPPNIFKQREATLAEAETAAGINTLLEKHLGRINTGELSFGPAANLLAQGLNAAGSSTPASRNFAEFRSDLEKLRNDSLRLNAGVQTDGDAQRAWNELFANLNDNEYVKQRLATIKALNERAETLKRASVERIDQEYGGVGSGEPTNSTTTGDFSALWN